jgi:hypothetical protein
MRRRLLNILLGVMLLAAPLSAQTYEIPQEPEIKPEARSVWQEWLIGSIFLVGCLVVAFKPAKRADLR